MDAARKKALMNAYKEKPVIGGVCCIKCSGNGREYLQSTRNIEGLRNRFNFALSMGTCPDPSLAKECDEYGAASFTFEVLEELKKGESQTDREFADDIEALYDMWVEKIKGEGTE